MSRKTMDWRRIGRLCVTVHTQHVPDEQEWSEYMKGVRRDVPMADQKVLVVSAGGGPNGNGLNRRLLQDIYFSRRASCTNQLKVQRIEFLSVYLQCNLVLPSKQAPGSHQTHGMLLFNGDHLARF